MKILSGHLTAVQKSNVKHLIAENMTEGKIGRQSYRIKNNGDSSYTVEIFIKDRGLIPVSGSQLRVSKYVSEIEL